MSKHPIWSEQDVIAAASIYPTKTQFKSGNSGAYQAMCRKFPHLIDKLFQHRPSKYTEEIIRDICSNYGSVKELEKGNRGASEALRLYFPRDLTWELFERKIKPPGYWTKQALILEAKKYRTKEDFYRGNLGAYSAANKQKLLDELGFEPGLQADNDSVYIWRANDQVFNGKTIYKIGVTSFRLGATRINRVASRASFTPSIVCHKQVGCGATEVESLILSIGDDPLFVGFDGASEFRAMDETEISNACEIVALFSV